MTGFLEKIVEIKKSEAARLRREVPLSILKRSLKEAPPPRALLLPPPFEGISIIAEIKKASPSAGSIKPNIDPVSLARGYERGGAAAISVLTEQHFFRGSVEDLVLVRSAVSIPVLRKDFILNAYEVYRSRCLGADLILLIAALLTRKELDDLVSLALELGMTPLVEVHSWGDIDKLQGLPCTLIGVNNRNLNKLTVSLDTSFEVAGRILNDFQDCRLVAESGIKNSQEILRLGRAGYSGVLIGEYFIRQKKPGDAVAEFVSNIKGKYQAIDSERLPA